ncbi:MAG TPA: hypothetical protein PLE30_02200 [Candidatus Kapabacteria bacterium]|nr:hypothetical protein [Candidatus Kapabacteria bacterium]
MKYCIILAIFLFNVVVSISQTNYPSSLGVELGLKTAVSVVQTPIGRQNALAIASLPDIGLLGYYPISEVSELGVNIRLKLNNYSYGMKDYGTGQVYKQSMSYISFNPGLYFSGFLFGFSFGFPISADYDGNSIEVGKINNLYDFNFGYSYDIFNDETARLSISLVGSYMLNPIIDNFTQNDPFKTIIPQVENYEINNSHNPRSAGVSLNISYQYLFIDK